jgi:hypothetical protein
MTQHTLGWSPERTWVFVVGVLEWTHADAYPPFPKQHRRDAELVAFFRAQGVPEEQIVYLQDQQATTRRIQQLLEDHLSASGPGDLLALYYCGHGGKHDDGAAYFASYDTDDRRNRGWLVDSIPATIGRCFRGASALLLADCCYSGSLAEAIAQQPDRIAYACLSSSLASELSTGNWTFTEELLAGLRGQAYVDADASGRITVQELAAQIGESMAFAEEQIANFALSGGFDPHLALASARPRLDAQIGRRVEARAEGEWYPAQIIDVRDERIKVHYYGYPPSDDEWLTSERIREAVRTTYPVGSAVEVQWKRRWYPATVLDVQRGVHYIQYDEFGSEWNEWVALKRIRQPA